MLQLFALLLLGGLQQTPSYHIDAQYVRVPVTVLDEQGRTVSELTKDDFELMDEGTLRPITNFVVDQSPVHVVFLLDASGSVREEIEAIKYATLRFAKSFTREDRLAVIAFADEIRELQDWTNDPKQLQKSLRKLERGYRTALYDALMSTAQEKLRSVPGKKVILLLSDGLDNESESTYAAALDGLVASDTSLYIVSRTRLVQDKVSESTRVKFLSEVMKNVLKDDKSFVDIYFKEKEAALNHLARTSGGRVFYPQNLVALGDSYVQIAYELKTQYVLTFLPPADSEKEFRSITVTCKRPVGKIYHRETYKVP